MKAQINMIGLITSQKNFPHMLSFYRDVMGFEIELKMESYVEFKSDNVRFAISTKEVMKQATGHKSFDEEKKGEAVELAFKADSPKQVDEWYKQLIEKGATAIKAPADQPWGQRAGFFADPEGNVHEVFGDL